MVTLAVNTGENRSKYLDFTRGLSYTYIAWVWDGTGDISDAYGIRPIPTTYILDRDGIVRHVHVGFGDGMEQTFVREIEALLE